MRSSGSTPSPSGRAPLRLLVHLAGEDHPKACTGRRLLARRRAARFRPSNYGGHPPVILDPYARDPLGPGDRDAAIRGGLLVVDCSWNRLTERGRFPGEEIRGIRRRLPILIATNPQHYGRPAQLNTVEAFAGALALLGRRTEARELLSGFHGGEAFLEVNRARLTAYESARSFDELRAAERSLFGGDPPAAL
jgi:pre-rRNA-processing protein TSR3